MPGTAIGGAGPPAGRLVAMMAGQPNVPLMNKSSVWLSKNSTSAACWPTRMLSIVIETLLEIGVVEARLGQCFDLADGSEVVDIVTCQPTAVEVVGVGKE